MATTVETPPTLGVTRAAPVRGPCEPHPPHPEAETRQGGHLSLADPTPHHTTPAGPCMPAPAAGMGGPDGPSTHLQRPNSTGQEELPHNVC